MDGGFKSVSELFSVFGALLVFGTNSVKWRNMVSKLDIFTMQVYKLMVVLQFYHEKCFHILSI